MSEGKTTYEFDRYIDGRLMVEGVHIGRQTTVERAMQEAARVASRGPNGEVPVLVLRAGCVALGLALGATVCPRADALSVDECMVGQCIACRALASYREGRG